jgi:hypothetical protein
MPKQSAPYQIKRYFDGSEVLWLITKEGDPRCAVDHFETKEEAEAERNRLNSAYCLDEIGIF